MRVIVKAFRRPPAVRPPDRNGGFPRLSDGVPHGLRCPASPRHALLAESLGKPSLWVIINAPWYYVFAEADSLAALEPPLVEAESGAHEGLNGTGQGRKLAS